jgi:hypothetical protein
MKLKEIKMTAVMIFALAFTLAAFAVAQQPTQPGQQKQPGKQMMSMDEMMQECRKHCQETAKSIDQTTKALEDASQSNDPARMRAANDQARKALAEMKNHMSMCMNMMDMMEKMHWQGPKETVSQNLAPQPDDQTSRFREVFGFHPNNRDVVTTIRERPGISHAFESSPCGTAA